MPIVMKDLMKVYKMGRSEVIALRGVDAEIREGEFVTIVGPSGCGKTTLLNAIGGLDIPTAGTIHVGGMNICHYSEKEFVNYRRNFVGFVFQFFNLVPTLSARENVELPMLLSKMPAEHRKARVNQLLVDVGMLERAEHLPDELSGGEQQRIAIAVALANNPPLILADEPTGELDSKTGSDILALFKRLQLVEKKTLVIVTHDTRIADISDKVMYMQDGKIIKIEQKAQPQSVYDAPQFTTPAPTITAAVPQMAVAPMYYPQQMPYQQQPPPPPQVVQAPPPVNPPPPLPPPTTSEKPKENTNTGQ